MTPQFSFILTSPSDEVKMTNILDYQGEFQGKKHGSQSYNDLSKKKNITHSCALLLLHLRRNYSRWSWELEKELIALEKDAQKTRKSVDWFLFYDEDRLEDWVYALESIRESEKK